MPKYTADSFSKILTKVQKSLDKYEEKNGKIKADFSNEQKIPLGTNFDGGGFRKAHPDEITTN